MTVGGDLRYRVEYFDYRDDPADLDLDRVKRGGEERERQRIRLRLKAAYKLGNDLAVIAGLATGNGESVSTNQTLSNLGTQKAIWIDLAYAEWAPGLLGEDGSMEIRAWATAIRKVAPLSVTSTMRTRPFSSIWEKADMMIPFVIG